MRGVMVMPLTGRRSTISSSSTRSRSSVQQQHTEMVANRDETIQQLRQDAAGLLVALQGTKATSTEAARSRAKLELEVEQAHDRRSRYVKHASA